MGQRGKTTGKSHSENLLHEDRFNSVYQLIRSKRYSQALRKLLSERAGKLAEGFAEEPNHAWYVVGDLYFKKKELRIATSAFRRSIAADGSDAQAYLALGNCYLGLGEHRKALKAYSQGLDADPRDAKLRYNLGNAYFDLGKYGQAATLYRSVNRSRDETVRQRAAFNLKLALSKLAGQSTNRTSE